LRGHADGVLEDPIEEKSIAHLRLARELLAVERQEFAPQCATTAAISDAVMRRVPAGARLRGAPAASRVILNPTRPAAINST